MVAETNQPRKSRIDANGMIVGTARDAAFNSYAVLWTPIPEPASVALAACAFGIALIGYSRPTASVPNKFVPS